MEHFFIIQTDWEGKPMLLRYLPFDTFEAAYNRAKTMRFATDIVKITPTSKTYYSLGRKNAPHQQLNQEIQTLIARGAQC